LKTTEKKKIIQKCIDGIISDDVGSFQNFREGMGEEKIEGCNRFADLATKTIKVTLEISTLAPKRD
jgi:hypothetical protein